MTKGVTTIVCDIGTGSVKAGYAGILIPTCIVRSVVASRRPGSMKQEEVRIGDDALTIPSEHRHEYIYRYPLEPSGAIKHWESLALLLLYVFQKKLGIMDGSNCQLLIPKMNSMTTKDLKRIIDFLFSQLNFQAITMHEQAALVMYTMGLKTGIVVEMGDGIVHIVPLYEGHAMPNLDKRFQIGGRAISTHVLKLLHRRQGHSLNARVDLDSARCVKEKLCYVAIGRDTEERQASHPFCLPDGTSISMDRETCEAAEALFAPSLMDLEGVGLSDLIYNTVQEAAIDCRAELSKNIILSGGTSLLVGIRDRVEKDLRKRYVRDLRRSDQSRADNSLFHVHAPKNREFLVFEGGAIFVDLIKANPKFWVSKSEYESYGAQPVFDKCRAF